jgi:hypothetical protein
VKLRDFERIAVAGKDVDFRWLDESAGIDCRLCGRKDIILSDESVTCDCGRTYKLHVYVTVVDPHEPESEPAESPEPVGGA